MVIAVDILLKQGDLGCLFGHCGSYVASDRRAQKRTETDINSRCESFLLFMLQQNAVKYTSCFTSNNFSQLCTIHCLGHLVGLVFFFKSCYGSLLRTQCLAQGKHVYTKQEDSFPHNLHCSASTLTPADDTGSTPDLFTMTWELGWLSWEIRNGY